MTPSMILQMVFHELIAEKNEECHANKKNLSFMLFAGVLCGATVGAASKTNDWSQPISVSLPAEGGQVNAVMQNYRNGCLVFVPERQLLWLGSPLPIEHQGYVCLSNAIVRIATGGDELFIDRQNIKLKGTPDEQTTSKARITADFERKIKDGPKFDNIQRISLGKILFGLSGLSPFLPPPQRVRPAKPATISNIQIEQGNTIVTLVGENNIKVILIFDDSMTVVKGMINDKVCYPRNQQSKMPDQNGIGQGTNSIQNSTNKLTGMNR